MESESEGQQLAREEQHADPENEGVLVVSHPDPSVSTEVVAEVFSQYGEIQYVRADSSKTAGGKKQDQNKPMLVEYYDVRDAERARRATTSTAGAQFEVNYGCASQSAVLTALMYYGSDALLLRFSKSLLPWPLLK